MKKIMMYILFFIMFMPFFVKAEQLTGVEYIQRIADNADGDSSSTNTIANTGLAYDGTVDNNLRYVGANPNNYIYFNRELWRIIGVMNNIEDKDGNKKSLLKIVRLASIGNFAWDTSESNINYGDGVNQWGPSGNYEGADLMVELNGDYLNYNLTEDPLWYNGRRNLRTATFDKSYVIKENAQSMINEVVWHTGYAASDNIEYTPAAFYANERSPIPNTNYGVYCTNPTECNDHIQRTPTWTGKVAIPYISDFGFATDGGRNISRSECLNDSMSGWGYCTEYNWFSMGSSEERTLSTYVGINSNASLLAYTTSRGSYLVGLNDYPSVVIVRPALYLNPDVVIYSGTGTKSNPYNAKVTAKSNISFDNDDSKGEIINVPSVLDVEELSEVSFGIEPAVGYTVEGIVIKDSDDNIVSYQRNGNNFTFTMPGSDVTITPVYAKFKGSVNVEIVNETESINIRIDDLTQVEYGEEVSFNISPIKGFFVKDVLVIDDEQNEIPITESGNDEFVFTMPASNVTIIPSYERVSSAIIVEDDENTKEFVIEVNDSTVVVYGETVRFILEPKDGFEVERIDIIDEENNKIEYVKTENENEYEFVMPYSDVTIKPIYRAIEVSDNSEDVEEKNVSNNFLEAVRNPNTGEKILIVTVIMLSSLGFGIYLYKSKLS